MAAIITQKFRVHNAKQFKEDFGEAASSTYIFIGRSNPWTDDTAPPTPNNGIGEEIDAWNDMIALKKVGSADVSHGIKRYDWTTNTKYSEYQHDVSSSNVATGTDASTNLYASKFYVMTDEYNVYKCIRTGRATGGTTVASTVKPTGTSATDLVETADTGATLFGYLWKYMYTISASDTIKFVTNDFIPVKTLGAQTEIDGTGTSGGLNSSAADDGSAQHDVETQAVDGAVDHVVVTAGGSGYTNGTYPNVVVDGDGSGAKVIITASGGAITKIVMEGTVAEHGSGYTNGTYPNVVVDGDGSGAKVIITASGGAITKIVMEGTVAEHGSGYTKASIDIEGAVSRSGGSAASAKVIISPKIGHGADPVQELGGNYVIVNSRLEFAEGSGDFPIDNDFRRIGLIQDPFSTGTTLATAPTLSAYNKLTCTSVSGLAVDDTISSVSGGVGDAVAVAKIVSITGSVISYITQVNTGGEYVNFANSNTVFEGTTNVGTASSVTAPEVVANSGQIMYIENRGAVTRASDQIEDIKLIIEM